MRKAASLVLIFVFTGILWSAAARAADDEKKDLKPQPEFMPASSSAAASFQPSLPTGGFGGGPRLEWPSKDGLSDGWIEKLKAGAKAQYRAARSWISQNLPHQNFQQPIASTRLYQREVEDAEKN